MTVLNLKDVANWDVDASGEWLVTARENGVYVSPLEDSKSERRLIGTHDSRVAWVDVSPTVPRVVSTDDAGEIRIWSLSEMRARPERTFLGPAPRSPAYLESHGVLDGRGARRCPSLERCRVPLGFEGAA